MIQLQNTDTLFENFFKFHRQLAGFNHDRLRPRTPSPNWEREFISKEIQLLTLEERLLAREIELIKETASAAPKNPDSFMKWFEGLKEVGPGQKSPLFLWLSKDANKDQMRWFIKQEVAGEAGFDDLAALTQVKLPTQAKLEVARNYWDEMGRGKEKGMHGPMLSEVAKEFELGSYELDEIVPEALALGNVLLGFAVNRRYAYHSIGALGAVELTAPARARKVYEGLRRLDISPKGREYFLIHSTLDVKHSMDWNKEVIYPLISENPEVMTSIAEGALVRLNAGARCFKVYEQHFGLTRH